MFWFSDNNNLLTCKIIHIGCYRERSFVEDSSFYRSVSSGRI